MTLNIKSFGHGKPLVLFHGWGFDLTIWQDLAESIQDDFTVYLVDLPGFGNSPMMSWDAFKSHLLARIPANFAVLGWSMGGLYATRLAVEESRVTHLINVASSPRFTMDKGWPGIEEKVLAAFHTNLISNPQQTISQFIELQLPKHDYQTLLDNSPSLEGLENGLHMLASADLREALDDLQCPACYMLGRLDSIVPKALHKTMQTRYPQFEYVLFNRAAHVPFLSDKGLFIIELQRFLS